MALSPGAVQLPPAHLSARVPWHDTDWTGRVCRSPAANQSCAILQNVKKKKNFEQEETDSGRSWTDLSAQDQDRVPPCVMERGGFMRPSAFQYERKHAYSFNPSHQHFAPTTQHMPAYSIEATPFRWMLREDGKHNADVWDIRFNNDLERRADELIGENWSPDWVQDHRNQLALLDSFFSALIPGKSLVLLYAKDVPLLEDRVPGARVLIGAGRITDVGRCREWDYDREPGELLRSVMWERAVHHSIRPGFDDGFLLPYQELLESEQLGGRDLTEFVARAPEDHFDEFSYVTELVDEDGAIGALTELARVVNLLPGVVEGPWDGVSAWIGEQLSEAWKARGPYPGLGAALTAIDVGHGAVIAHRIKEAMPEGADFWECFEEGMYEAGVGRGPANGLVGRMAAKIWGKVYRDDDLYDVFKLISRFSLTPVQAARALGLGTTSGAPSYGELLENPYQIYELDRCRDDSVSLLTVDRGLFPQETSARDALEADPLPVPLDEANDDRRVRAVCVEVLEKAATDGHTLLDEAGLRTALPKLRVEPQCNPSDVAWEVATDEFEPVLLPTQLADDMGCGWQLERLARAGDLIATTVGERIDEGPIDVAWPWREEIDKSIDADLRLGDELEKAARREKSDALEKLARARIGVLVGPAGTGKTTMLKALCSHPDVAHGGVLLVAPTGKARVQLGGLVGAQALTLAQWLRPDRWAYERGYFMNEAAPRSSMYRTVVVDEASMLTEEMLAALIDSTRSVDRLILCGDHRQLPPIGAGRPFADLVKHFGSLEQVGAIGGGGLAVLRIGMRQRVGEDARAAERDDLHIADWFASESSSSLGGETLARVLRGDGDGTIEIECWDQEDDLHKKLVERLASDPDLELEPGDSDRLKETLGATGTYKGRPSFPRGTSGSGAEHWQLLTPVRSRPGGVAGLNKLVRRIWRAGHAHHARESRFHASPMGADEILVSDKVMSVDNHRRDGWRVETKQSLESYVANGEIGVVVGAPKSKKGVPWGLCVELSSQPGFQFTFSEKELNSDGDRTYLELAYGITIHKSQGSQFGLTFVVVPNPCPLLSPELLYTAITRHRERVVLYVQGDPAELRGMGSPERSETGRRLTRLFRRPHPFEATEGNVLDAAYVHRTKNKELVLSKSEVIVADTLRGLDIPYEYEERLAMPDGSWKKPDFTIHRAGLPPVYWEHLGMLGNHGYRADWQAKRAWYAKHDILPWTEGGGRAGTLVWSDEARSTAGIDSGEIERLAREVFEVPPSGTTA